jgi:cathepsin F
MKTGIIYLSLIIAAFCQNQSNEEELFSAFTKFMEKNGKSYESQNVMESRYDIFKENYERMQNLKPSIENENDNNFSKFLDLTANEFQSSYLNLQTSFIDLIKNKVYKGSMLEEIDGQELKNEPGFFTSSDPELTETNQQLKNKDDKNLRLLVTLPTNFDWRTYGAVTPVKYQGTCGCCWAFATVGNLEGLYYIKYKKSVSLSEQQLLNCDNSQQGCNGGAIQNAYTYLQGTNGLGAMNQTPYLFYKSTCRAVTGIAKVRGYKLAGSTDETQIQQMLYSYGPLATTLNANLLQYYSSGIMDYSSTQCNPNNLNHGVLLVGWGVQGGIPYWLIKNSWGANWGEKGYFRIRRGRGTCGINKYVLTGLIS